MKNKILILGKGYIGERLHQELKAPISAKKIHTFNDIQSLINHHKPKILINGIGHTGRNNVDGCEKALDKTISANTYVPLLLGEAALRNNIKLIHLGSGCIYHYKYGRQKPIAETLIPDYYDLYYSRTKIYTDNALLELSKRANVLIVRIRVPLDDRAHPRNILNKLIKYKTVIDVPNSVTYIPDFIKALKHLIKKDARGIYNVVNKGGLRYPNLLDEYKKYRPGFKYSVIPLKKLNMNRTNLLLSTSKLERSGFRVRPMKDVIKECVKNYIQS